MASLYLDVELSQETELKNLMSPQEDETSRDQLVSILASSQKRGEVSLKNNAEVLAQLSALGVRFEEGRHPDL